MSPSPFILYLCVFLTFFTSDHCSCWVNYTYIDPKLSGDRMTSYLSCFLLSYLLRVIKWKQSKHGGVLGPSRVCLAADIVR